MCEVLSFLFFCLRMICEKFLIFFYILCDSGCFFVFFLNFVWEIGVDWFKWIFLCIFGVLCISGLILLSVVLFFLDMIMYFIFVFMELIINFKINFF